MDNVADTLMATLAAGGESQESVARAMVKVRWSLLIISGHCLSHLLGYRQLAMIRDYVRRSKDM